MTFTPWYRMPECLNSNGKKILWDRERELNRVNRKDRRFKTLLFNLQLFAGTTYYVKNGGNDGADGLSDENAWATLGKVNSFVGFNAGDTIQFKRGSTWIETLVIDTDGASGNHITFSDYGSGDLPLIDGNGERNGNNGNGIEIAASYISIENIKIYDVYDAGIFCDSARTNINITDIEVDTTVTSGGIDLRQCSYVVVDGCIVRNTGNNGIVVWGSAANAANNITIKNCGVYDTVSNDGIILHRDGSDNEVGSTFLIEDCYCEGCAESGIDINSGTAVIVRGCETYANDEGGIAIGGGAATVDDVTVYNHLSREEPVLETGAALNIEGDCINILVYNSIFIGSTFVEATLDGDSVEIYNCVFWNAAAARAITITSGSNENVTMKNCICKGGISTYNAARTLGYATYTFDYNCYNDAGDIFYSEGVGGRDFAYMQGTWGQEANGLNVDPKLVSDTNVHLQSDSPCIDQGIDLSGTFIDDYAGRTRPIGLGWDMGAYEYSPISLVAVLKD